MNHFTPLCEDCGYVLEGLPPSASCSECGRPVAASLPSARAGSPWQRRPSIASYILTNEAALRRPRELFSQIRLERRSGTTLLVLNSLAAGFLIAAIWSGAFYFDPVRAARTARWPMDLLIYAWAIPLEVAVLALVFVGMTVVEYLGIRFFAARRQWRLTPEGAWQVCCHASVGWIIFAFLPMLAMSLAYVLNLHVGTVMGKIVSLASAGQFSLGTLASATLFCSALLAGLIVYETLVHIGTRRCRFAATAPRA